MHILQTKVAGSSLTSLPTGIFTSPPDKASACLLPSKCCLALAFELKETLQRTQEDLAASDAPDDFFLATGSSTRFPRSTDQCVTIEGDESIASWDLLRLWPAPGFYKTTEHYDINAEKLAAV